jgi:hypothetical protein
MTTSEIMATVQVAFNKFVKKVLKKSYNSTIDVQFGIYQGWLYDGWLTINLKPSHGWRDWLINFMAWGKMHYGYRWEFTKYGGDILSTIYASKELWEASRKGVIIAGRSKGGAEAIMLGMLMTKYSFHDYKNVIVGAIDPPKAFGKRQAIDIPVTTICYRNDIVPSLPMWYHHAGDFLQLGERTHGLSFKDHERATTDYDLIRVWFE